MLNEPALPDLALLHRALIEAAEAAGQLALKDYVRGGPTRARVDWKAGGSPVTSADFAVDTFLEARLRAAFPLAWHSEERAESWQGAARQPLAFVIDPIDGTRDFATGGDAWCVAIGVLAHGKPVAGVVHMPARGQTLSGFAGGGAFMGGVLLSPREMPATPWRANGPKPAVEAFARLHGVALSHSGSLPALAHRLLAPLKNESDVALARGGGHDWDIVASAAILSEAGARVLTLSGECPNFELLGQEQPPLMAASVSLFDKIGALGLTDPA